MRKGMFYGSGAMLAVLLAGAVMLSGCRGDSSDTESGADASEPVARPAADAPPDRCSFDPEKPVVQDFAALVGADDPLRGNPAAPVTVVEFFDPNCPHCKTLHPIMTEAAERYGEQARFVYKPLALPGWDHSVPQVAALLAAAEEGKFFEMLDRQFAYQRRGGISLDQLSAFADEIGMDSAAMRAGIEANQYLGPINKAREQAIEAGLRGVPAVIIDGRYVASRSRTVACLGQLIDEAAG